PDSVPQFRLVAEEVEKVNPDLVVRDADGKVSTVRYEAVNAMLLNEFLKEHRKVQEQEVTITEVKSAGAKQEAALAQQEKEINAPCGPAACSRKISKSEQLRTLSRLVTG